MAEEMEVYPEEQVVGVVDDGDEVRQVIDDLEGEGVARDRVEVLAGAAGRERLDASGTEHGWTKRALRTVQKVLGDERERFDKLNEELERGNYVVQVPIVGDDDGQRETSKQQIGDVLRAHGARHVAFYGKYQIEELEIGD